jgi:hypothetical protein
MTIATTPKTGSVQDPGQLARSTSNLGLVLRSWRTQHETDTIPATLHTVTSQPWVSARKMLSSSEDATTKSPQTTAVERNDSRQHFNMSPAPSLALSVRSNAAKLTAGKKTHMVKLVCATLARSSTSGFPVHVTYLASVRAGTQLHQADISSAADGSQQFTLHNRRPAVREIRAPRVANRSGVEVDAEEGRGDGTKRSAIRGLGLGEAGAATGRGCPVCSWQ